MILDVSKRIRKLAEFLHKLLTKRKLIQKENLGQENLSAYSKIISRGFTSLLINRWVGIDSMLIITKNREILNLSLFKESLKERFNAKSPSFYELTF